MKTYKLENNRPEPTDEERQLLETYANGKYAAKLADDIKDRVTDIVMRYGEISVEHGILMPGESVSYPMPTLEEWDERILRAQERVDTFREMAKNHDAGEEELRLAEEHLAIVQKYREDLVLVLRWEAIIKEWKDYFKAAGVIHAKKVPTAKFLQVRRKASRKLAPPPPPPAPAVA